MLGYAAVVLFATTVFVARAGAAAGDLDTSFDGDGIALTTVGYQPGSIVYPVAANSVAIQGDGKIVAAGYSSNDVSEFALVRYNTDGSLDATFREGGIVKTDGGYFAKAVAIQSDGKIVAAGVSNGGEFAAVRYNTDGTLDASFGEDGIAVATTGTGIANSVAIQTDGKIVAVGGVNDEFAVVRYDASGSLDATFGGGGIVTTQLGVSGSAHSVAIQSDGKIVVAGDSTTDAWVYETEVVRYNTDGSLDVTFGGNGIVKADVGEFANSVAIQSDGKIVAVGAVSGMFAAVRYSTDGSLDTTFGSGGIAYIDWGAGVAASLAIQTDGKIVAAGAVIGMFGAARFNSDGQLDTTFNGYGAIMTEGGYEDQANSVAMWNDGKIVVAGRFSNEFGVLRYNADGSLDTTFDGDGIVTTAVRPTDARATSVAIQSDGKIVAAGYALSDTSEFALARYNADGSLDATFGGDGNVTTAIGTTSFAFSAAIQTDGKIVVAGMSDNGGDQLTVVRYKTDGSLDASFGGDGIVTTPGPTALAVAIQADGKIVAAGYGADSQFAVLRYNTDGSLDTAFGGNGSVTTVIGTRSYALSVAIQDNGKIVACGDSDDGGGPEFVVVRYNADGGLDTSFGGNGIVTTALGTSGRAYSAAIQSDGKIVAAGVASDDLFPGGRFAVVRYNADGSLDATFDGDGKVTTRVDSAGAGGLYDWAQSVAIQANGKIVAAGSTSPAFKFAVVRYNANGSLDASFGGDGKVTTVVQQESVVNSVAIQSDGKIVVAGSSANYVYHKFALARYISDVTPCGNGILNAGEECDDGNTGSGDCCSSNCQFEASSVVCRASAGACDPAENCTGSSPTCPADAKSTGMCRSANGDCDLADYCDGSSNNCPPDAFRSSATQCRASEGTCDPAENCTGTSATCPADAKSTTACRPAAGVCDVAEDCDGLSDDCPSDGFKSASTECRAATGLCDLAEKCTGNSVACPIDSYESASTVCRASAGVCDVPEDCTGSGPSCPVNAFASSATTCRTANGPCDVAETCTGNSAACPADAVAETSKVCRTSAGVCDLSESCDGASKTCPTDLFVSADTPCASDGLPCTRDVCSGNSAMCTHPPGNAGAVCRPAVGACDVAEICSGSASSCPADAVANAATLCRAVTGECDAAENCDGTNKQCPGDLFETAGVFCADDGNVCSDDQCDGLGTCTHPPNSLPCDDGLFCDGTDTCADGSCGVHTGSPCPGPDGDANCVESCDEATQSCAGKDPDTAACDDGNSDTIADRCVAGQCVGQPRGGRCGDADGYCPNDCSIENDVDCEVCLTRAVLLSECRVRLRRRTSQQGMDRLTAACLLDTCDGVGGISPSSEGVRFTVGDASGLAFDDSLAGSACTQRPTGYSCRATSKTDTGIRILKLRALSPCQYKLRLKLTKSDLSQLDTTQSPWVPTLIVGDDCGDISCPVVDPRKALCPGTCGNDDASDPGEQCDGLDDTACPGRCDTTCTCR